MIAPESSHHWQVYLVPPTFVPGGAHTAIAGQTAGVFGPQIPACRAVGSLPEMLQQFDVELPVAPLQMWMFKLQHPHVAQSASLLHGISLPASVVVVEPPVSVVVVSPPSRVVVVVGRAEVAEPQQTTRPVFRQLRLQHFFRLRLQAFVARRRQKACRLGEQFARRGSAAAQDATDSRHDVRHCLQTGFGFAAAAGNASADPSAIATTNTAGNQRSDRMPRRLHAARAQDNSTPATLPRGAVPAAAPICRARLDEPSVRKRATAAASMNASASKPFCERPT